MELTNKRVGNKALAMLMVASVLTAGVVIEVPKAEAATPNAESDFTTAVAAGGVSISTYKGVSKDVVIPATIGGKAVVGIGANAFYQKQLTSVDIPGSVESIGGMAFYGNELTSIVLPEGVATLGSQVFGNNKLTSVTMPGSLTMISELAFSQNQLTNIVIPDGVKSVGLQAFSQNQLTTVVIGEGVTSIGVRAFYSNNITSLTIGKSVTAIAENAFTDNKLTKVVFPKSLTTIGTSAFSTNELTNIELSDGLITIGANAFSTNKLTSVTIPGSVTTIGDSAFYGNKLTDVVIPGSVTSIGNYAFYVNQVNAADLTIWGVDPSVAKNHALSNGYTFNLGTPDPTPGAGDSQTATLNLEGGDLTLETAEINDFGSIKLKNQPQTVTTGFDDKFTVTDNRGTGLGWRLDVSATQFSEVAPVGGFAGGALTGFTLPIGSLMVNGLDTIERTEGAPGGNPSIAGLSNTVIDGSSLATVSNAGLNEGAGKFALTFGEEALSLVVDSSTAKVDTLNYPTGATPYESTVTWDLVSAP